MIKVILRDTREVLIKDADTAVYVGKTQAVAHIEAVAKVLEVSKDGEVLASFNADDVIYFIEEKEDDSQPLGD